MGILGSACPRIARSWRARRPSAAIVADLAELIAPQGRLALINGEAADVSVFMRKSVSVHYELMFTRPLFQTADIEAQHRLLNEVADLVESGRVRSTMRENYGRIDAANLMRAMAFLKSVADLCAIVAKIEGKGASLRILAMNLDTATPTGRLMLNVIGSVAQAARSSASCCADLRPRAADGARRPG